MPGSTRENRAAVTQSLLATPEAFDFLAALTLLGSQTDAAGTRRLPGDFRFVANPSLAYPPTQLTQAFGYESPTLAMNFLGLHGPTGLLPAHMTQAVATDGPEFTLTQFLDFCNHQFAIAFGQAATRSQMAMLARESTPNPTTGDADGADPLTRLMVAIAGVGNGIGGAVHPGARAYESRDYELSVGRYFAAAWRHRPMPLTSLQSLLRELLGVAIRVIPCEPVHVEVDPAWQFRLRPNPNKSSSAAQAPGRHVKSPLRQSEAQSIVIGKRMKIAQGGVLIRIGPLDIRTFCRLLPPGAAGARGRQIRKRLLWRLCSLIGAALGPCSEFVLQPVLAKQHIKPWNLRRYSGARVPGAKASPDRHQAGAFEPPAMLGRTIFLLRKEKAPSDDFYFDRDFDQLKISSTDLSRSMSHSHLHRPSKK